MKNKLLWKIQKQIPKNRKKYLKKYNFRKKYSYLPYLWGQNRKYRYHMKDFILLKKMKRKKFRCLYIRQILMDLNWTFSSSLMAH